MNKRIIAVIYVLALLVTLVVSLFSIPVYLAWALRAAVAVAALVGVYLVARNKDEYRYTVAKDREKKNRKK